MSPDRPAREDEIEITPEMVARGVEFCRDSALGTLSNKLVSPEFVQDFLDRCLRPQV